MFANKLNVVIDWFWTIAPRGFIILSSFVCVAVTSSRPQCCISILIHRTRHASVSPYVKGSKNRFRLPVICPFHSSSDLRCVLPLLRSFTTSQIQPSPSIETTLSAGVALSNNVFQSSRGQGCALDYCVWSHWQPRCPATICGAKEERDKNWCGWLDDSGESGACLQYDSIC